MKKIICLWGGPGTGKSTTCAGIYAKLKQLGYDSEMNREYVKDWVWEGRTILDGDQVYITSKQARSERIYMNSGLDFIITDSPLALSIYYGNKYDKYEREFGACGNIIKQHHSLCKDLGYKVEHFFLNRIKEYNPNGRFQTEDEAKLIDSELLQILKDLNINYETLNCDENVIDNIVKSVIK